MATLRTSITAAAIGLSLLLGLPSVALAQTDFIDDIDIDLEQDGGELDLWPGPENEVIDGVEFPHDDHPYPRLDETPTIVEPDWGFPDDYEPIDHDLQNDSGYDPENETCGGEPITHYVEPGVLFRGTPGHDVILGTPGPDYIETGGGADKVCGLGGDDVIRAEGVHEADVVVLGGVARIALAVWGGDGDDQIHVRGTGFVSLYGGHGADIVEFGPGDLRGAINGGADDDQIFVSAGSAHVEGGDGDDVVKVSATGAVRAEGGEGNDYLIGGPSFDWLDGGPGFDILLGRGDTDVLVGGEDDDLLLGGHGGDYLFGDGEAGLSGVDLGGHNQCNGGKDVDILYHCG